MFNKLASDFFLSKVCNYLRSEEMLKNKLRIIEKFVTVAREKDLLTINGILHSLFGAFQVIFCFTALGKRDAPLSNCDMEFSTFQCCSSF
jgi:hypothetical protein